MSLSQKRTSSSSNNKTLTLESISIDSLKQNVKQESNQKKRSIFDEDDDFLLGIFNDDNNNNNNNVKKTVLVIPGTSNLKQPTSIKPPTTTVQDTDHDDKNKPCAKSRLLTTSLTKSQPKVILQVVSR